jgi:hypothetical protein
MVIDWIDAPTLGRVVRGDPVSLVEHARRVVVEVGELPGDLPSYVDIGTVGAWSDTAQLVLQKLAKLVVDGRFTPRTWTPCSC